MIREDVGNSKMKKQCVIITAYKNPEILRELLDVLN